ncbi:MAG: hypothetical protein ACRDI2_24040, partial [Chloroflexota bacterium]
AGLLLVAILPAVARGGAPPRATFGASPSRETVGLLELMPAVPVAGQPLTVRLTFTDPSLIGAVPAIVPFESPRAGDVVTGYLRAGSQPGVYQATFTPREPGRRWLSVFFPIEELRSAASASFMVYRSENAPSQTPLAPRPVVLRPEPGPQADLPSWLEPATYLALVLLFGGATAGIALTLRRGTGG